MDTKQIILAARQVANFVLSEEVHFKSKTYRPVCNHLGAVLADSILQSGLKYSSVVKPRVNRILSEYPNAIVISELISIVENGQTSDFLNWKHPTKISRFEKLVKAINNRNIDSTKQLNEELLKDEFYFYLQKIKGIGPKTVDYMACLVGIETVAVDRHICAFAKHIGIEKKNYTFLKQVFCFAADFLSISRRDFDAWIWERQAVLQKSQS